jgi:hypothetical protein
LNPLKGPAGGTVSATVQAKPLAESSYCHVYAAGHAVLNV